MLKELICAVALTGTIGTTTPQNSNDGTYYQDVTITESYEFETNEVNSVDDLIIGNIYKYTIDEGIYSSNVLFITNYVHLYPYQNNNITCYLHTNYRFYMYDNSIYFYNQDLNQWFLRTYANEIQFPLTFEFVYQGNFYAPYINKVSKSDYLGEHTVTVTPKEFNGLFAIFDNFLHERLYSGGILDTTNVTVFNATMSLGQWLSTTTSIVLLSLIVLLLVLLIKFIFKYVGGMMIWRS